MELVLPSPLYTSVFERYLKSVQAEGEVVYITSWPTAQECLNPTISKNALALLNDVSEHTHVVLDNERQVKLLRGKVGMLGIVSQQPTPHSQSCGLKY